MRVRLWLVIVVLVACVAGASSCVVSLPSGDRADRDYGSDLDTEWKDAEIGETVELQGPSEDARLTVTLEALVDPAPADATPYNEEPLPFNEDERLVEFRLQISNVGTTAFEFDPNWDSVAMEAGDGTGPLTTNFFGFEPQATYTEPDRYAPGQARTGSVVFTTDDTSKIRTFELAIRGLDGLVGGRWSIP